MTTSAAGDRHTRFVAEGLFVYGSLRFPEVLTILLGRVPAPETAAAPGWRVKALPGAVYPGLAPDPEGSADGLLLTGLSDAERVLLDDFEGDAYEPRLLPLADGRHGWAYVWRYEAAPDDWDLVRFARRDLAAYLRECRVWRRAYGAMPEGGGRLGDQETTA
ncbi:gamma-glutamylcyclotransferase family protein [Thermomonospora umbrina]|uniref:Putative gamma-glutamylcyclotransferase n=1 Tax=Thermomonospora umbrina TaxID=111806 RepID=A0A3D9SM69_9ACTN|nr:gamma-glutamylcyclotransferase family protein [Thermomonospora umbrina]REE97019.1 gamma-glutamyl AIG2-like cyclotransferase [Thermomonospora umbrina]